MSNENRYKIKPIRDKSICVLVSRGVPAEDAAIVVDSMLEADICGVATHGIRMLCSYIQKIDKGEISLDKSEVIKSVPAFTLLDAKNSIGAISAYKATKIAIDKAKKSGIHVVFSRNNNTYGSAFYYVEKIAKAGMIGFTCCNSPAAMPAFNGLEPMLGTNPLAFACPSKSEGTIILDMATSIVAKSKFEMARINGQKLPNGWASDKNGIPTDDPIEAIKGFVMPMAGFKGYGIAMTIDIVSGVLSGAGYLNKVGKFYSKGRGGMNVGQLFIAVNVDIVYEGDFASDMDLYIQTLRKSKTLKGRMIRVPGENKALARKEAYEKGVILTDDTVEKLERLFAVELMKEC